MSIPVTRTSNHARGRRKPRHWRKDKRAQRLAQKRARRAQRGKR